MQQTTPRTGAPRRGLQSGLWAVSILRASKPGLLLRQGKAVNFEIRFFFGRLPLHTGKLEKKKKHQQNHQSTGNTSLHLEHILDDGSIRLSGLEGLEIHSCKSCIVVDLAFRTHVQVVSSWRAAATADGSLSAWIP